MAADVPLEYPEAERDIAMKRLQQLLSSEASLSEESEFIVEVGAPAEHILKVAKGRVQT
jgi:hypothetical protein